MLRYLRLEIRSETDGRAGEPHLKVKLAQMKEEMGKLTHTGGGWWLARWPDLAHRS